MARILMTLLAWLCLTSCTTIYYNFWETFGQEKRDLLKSKVEKVQYGQEDVQKEFKDTLERIRSEYKFDGGSLEETYDALSADYESAKGKAEELSNRIDKVEDIAEDLFEEWAEEADQITNSNYRKDSLAKRKQAMAKFKDMLGAMHRVEKTLTPVLTRLKDQVLYLKHNLNARSVGAFKSEFAKITNDVQKLNNEIQESSKAADQFIQNLNS